MHNLDLAQADPLVLAYIGDAYFSLKVREYLINRSRAGSGFLNAQAKTFVSAVAQAQIWDAIFDTLSSEEQDLGRRARNRHNTSTAKNSTIAQYKKATALECVLGYHYLSNNTERLAQILQTIFTLRGAQDAQDK